MPLAAAKAFYFFFYAGLCALIPYLILYYRSLGLDGHHIGLLTAATPLMMLIGAPLWGIFADALRRNRELLMLALAGSALLIAFAVNQRGFAILLVLVMAFAFFHAPIVSLIDSITLEQLGERRELYGRQRIFGSVGWGRMEPLVGWLADLRGLGAAFLCYFAFQACAFAAAARLPAGRIAVRVDWAAGLRAIAASRAWLFFLAVAFISGAGMAVVHYYLFLYLEQLGFSRAFMGWTMVASTLGEIPVMFLAAPILRRWSSHRLLQVSLALIVIRTLGYSCTTSGAAILLLQLLHGPSFALFWIGGVTRAHELAPPGMAATSQALFGAVASGLAAAAGGYFGGLLIGSIGGPLLYRATGCFVLAGLGLLTLADRRR